MTAAYLDALADLGLPSDWTVTVERRPRRQSIGVEIRPGGALAVLVPPDVPADRVAHFVHTKRVWIASNLERAKRLAPNFAVKNLSDGEAFDLLGRRYRLQVVERGPLARFDTGEGLLRVRRDSREVMGKAIATLFCAHGLKWAQEHGPRHERRFGLLRVRYQVRHLGRRRWGIYQKADHLVTLHWPLFGLPEPVVDYVLVHELAHASDPTGSPHGRVWRQRMHRFMPDWQHRKQLLDDLGRHVWMGDCSRDDVP